MILNLTYLHDHRHAHWFHLIAALPVSVDEFRIWVHLICFDVYFICDPIFCVWAVTLTLVYETAQKWVWHPCWLSCCTFPNQDFILSRRDGIAWLGNPISISFSDIPGYNVRRKHALSVFSSVLTNNAAAKAECMQQILWTEMSIICCKETKYTNYIQ